MNLAISLRGLNKRFGNTWAVKNLSLDIPYGTICAFLGPNGAGKSTTLRLVAGLLFPDSGSILVGGMNPMKQWIGVRRNLSYMPDIPFLYGKLTGEEFLRFVGGLHSMEEPILSDRIAYFVDKFALSQYHRLRVEGYSHGTRQKYVVSAALISSPKVLLVDEPMVGLDPASRRTLMDLFRQEADNGTGILLSTHTLSVAQDMADHIAVIDKGSLVLSKPTKELLAPGTGLSLENLFLSITSGES